MTILLTGASGFLGRHVLSLLLAGGHTVFAASRLPLQTVATAGNFTPLTVDLASGAGLDQVPWAKIDGIIHLAASGVKACRRSWSDGLAVNVVGTQRLLAAIKNYSVRNPPVFIARTFYEKLTELSPALLDNPYIATKRAGNELSHLWARDYAGATVFGVFFQVYGPGDDAGNVLNYAARELKARRPALFGSGRGLRDWIYVSDAAAAVVASIIDVKSGCQEVDIGTGELVSIRTVVEQVEKISGTVGNLVFDPEKDRPDVDLVLAAREFPARWSPQVTIEQGLLNLYSNT